MTVNRANGSGAAARHCMVVHAAHPVLEALQDAALLQSQPASAVVCVYMCVYSDTKMQT